MKDKKKVLKKGIWSKLIIGLIMITAVYAIFIRPSYYKFNGGEAHLAPVQMQRFMPDHVKLAVIGDYIYECNVNGLVKKDLEGTAIWSKSYYIEAPLLVSAGGYLAVADITGKTVYVFNEEGFIRTIDESWQVIDVHINTHGFLTTIMENEKQNIINYYNAEGELVITRATSYFEDGYPLAVATSNDVTKMMTAYLNVTNNRLQSNISFFGFEDQYDKYNELIIGGFTYENTLANRIIWMDNDKSIAVFDNSVVLYDCKGDPKVIATLPIMAELKQLELTEDSVIIMFGNAITESEMKQENSVCVYDFEGKLITQLYFDEPIQAIKGTKDNYYVITNSKVIKFEGKKREWFSSTYLTINNFFEINENEFLATTDQGYEILKIREK